MSDSAASQRLAFVQNHLQVAPCASEDPKKKSPIESMTEERVKATFNVRELTNFLDGGEKYTQIREKFMLELERDPTFRMHDMYDVTKDEIRVRTMEKFRTIVHYVSAEPVPIFTMRMQTISLIDPGFWTRFGVHYGLFFGALRGSATSSQFSHWVSKGALALNGMVGCFAMTELGHGSNVAGLETTAHFDEASDQFIIHTPTVTATKWWIGGAAHTATHTVVFAQLYVRGKRYGVKSFVVQLRDTRTYTLMPGINIGDIGKKMGRDGIDNGWIQFTNVRIPRTNMLMKHTKVSRAGEVKEPAMAQLTYGALIQGRVAMVVDSGNIAKKAVTIAGRYAAVRRQFSSSPHEAQETKLIDYAIHQYRLMPILAMAYAFHFTGVETQKLYDDLMDKLESTQPDDSSMQDTLDTLKETHATSAGLKAFCTWSTLNAIEACRQTLGGHGYSAYTGLATTYNDFAVHCTWEGDNTILTLQSGRYLVSCYREALAGKTQPEGVNYLNHLDTLLNQGCAVKTNEEILNFDIIEQAWGVVTANVVKKAGDDFEASMKQGMNPEAAYEECSQARLAAAKIHSFGYVFRRFAQAVKNAPESLRPVLTKVCFLYGLYSIEQNAGFFLQYRYFTPSQMDYIRAQVNVFCREVRQEYIPLIDAFNYSDYMVNSPLGVYDGNVYEKYFDQVKRQNPVGGSHPYLPLIQSLLRRDIEDDEPLEDDDEDDE
ncbi:fatty-acyl coenzyme A oxidase [Mortierella polycephala]|uniref:Acyl-coenzyme A oxidase n=1 Tax=Mortierella polycephala TaxID=41804 RepID=A0A9P6UAY0_9FUNG|nr:fatty-acyl coenzyme A oxidase [Mortierella polycephala]